MESLQSPFDYHLRDDHIAVLTLNRPEKRNALNRSLSEGLAEGLRRFDQEREAWVGILIGTGKAFCAGADLSAMNEVSQAGGDWADGIDYVTELFDELKRRNKPLIAAVNGACMGGGLGLAHECSLIVAAESAKFGMPEVAVGLPNFSYWDTWKTIGLRRSLEMSLVGDFLDAQRMLEMGFVNRVVPDEALFEQAVALAQRITRNAPLAVAGAERGIRFTLTHSPDEWPEAARGIWQDVLASEDLAEGLDAFANKRQPNWRNR